MLTATYYGSLGLALLCALGLGFLWGRWDRHARTRIHFNRRRFARREEEQIMADLTRLNTAVAAIAAYIQALKTAPPVEDPAVQVGVDAAAAELEAQLPPPA